MSLPVGLPRWTKARGRRAAEKGQATVAAKALLRKLDHESVQVGTPVPRKRPGVA